jgi:hypothetical protein
MMGDTPAGLRQLNEYEKGLGALKQLPAEVRSHIYGFLTVRDHLGLQLASKALRSEANLPRTVVCHLLHTVRMVHDSEKNGHTQGTIEQMQKVAHFTQIAEERWKTALYDIPQWEVLKNEVGEFVDPTGMQRQTARLAANTGPFKFKPQQKTWRCVMQ